MFCPLCNCVEHFNVIWENQIASLVFDNYGLHYGHMLLVPKNHVLNLSCVYPNVSSCLSEIVRQMQQFFQTEILVYEHGNVTENQTSRPSIDHAHIHFLPAFHGTKRIFNLFYEGVNCTKVSLPVFYEQEKKHPYHLLAVNGMEAVSTFSKLKSEAFREAYAICEGIKYWDWKISGEAIKKYNEQHYDDKLLLKQFIIKESKHGGIKQF